jgi:DNA-binding response OmpR family regulator
MMSEEAVVLHETAPMNMLIVDDEPTIREACGEVAQLTGTNATMVATAEEAIEILENTAIDIVLTDLMLPHTSGLELLKRVHDTHPNPPVIVLTQYGTIDSAVAATRMGAIDYVTKPFRIEELRARLERASRAVELGRKINCCGSNCARGRGSAASSVYPRECCGYTNHSEGGRPLSPLAKQLAQTAFHNFLLNLLTTVLSNGRYSC